MLTRRKMLAGICVLGAVTLGSRPFAPFAAAGEIYTGLLSNTAVGGYDPVAYHTQGKPVQGSGSFTTRWKGATWRFASAENRALFLADPERYAPQYGGHCAWAVSQGYTAKGDPNHWRVVDGKLYLNYNAQVQTDWEKDIPGHIRNANGNWPKVKPD